MEYEPDYEHIFKKKKNGAQEFYEAYKESVALILKKNLSDTLRKIASKGRLQGSETSVNGGVRMISELFDKKFAIDNGTLPNGIALEAHTFFNEQEGQTGCDLLFTYEVFANQNSVPMISKCTPVQAKIAEIQKSGNETFLYCKDPHLKSQLEIILKISRAHGLLLMYTENHGAFVTHASAALQAMGSSKTVMRLNTSLAKESGHLAELLAICTGGDVNLSPQQLSATRKSNGKFDDKDYLEKFTANAEKITQVKAGKIFEKKAKKDRSKKTIEIVAITATLPPP